MKVLKTAKENNFGKELVCKGHGIGATGGCGALLLVAPGDVKSSYDGDGDTNYWFTCPECKANTYVSYSTFYGCYA